MIVNKTKILGQYFTPDTLASDIVKATKHLYPREYLSVVEPAFGQGTFLTALLNENIKFEDFLGVEIDNTLHKELFDKVEVINADFTDTMPQKQYDLLITNPPYTRHHLLEAEQKTKMSLKIKNEIGISINGLSGLHCYFLLLADKWLKENGIAVWLLPTEFLDVNYGKQIKEYLLNNVQLLSVHIYNTTTSSLFDNATVSSCVVVYKKAHPKENEYVTFTFGDTMNHPTQTRQVSRQELTISEKWLKLLNMEKSNISRTSNSSIADYFYIKRGIATGCNKYFILSREEIENKDLPLCCFTPIIENVRNISNPIIESDNKGFPIIKQQLFVLNTDLSIKEIEKRFPTLYEYLLYGIQLGVKNRYLVGKRKVWYKQEMRTPAPFYCSYMARQKNEKSFHFIWNKTNVIVSNNFLMLYPKPCLENAINKNILTYNEVYNALAVIESEVFSKQARIYATGLSKLEPTELGKVELRLNL